MPHDPNAPFDQTVLDMIEHSPIGAVPNTPTYQDALKRLIAAHKIYAHADHKGGFVTARSLAALPSFFASNFVEFAASRIGASALESNASIFTRYVQSLPAALHAKAEGYRNVIAVRPPHHRDKLHAGHDPLHTLVLVPGTGPHHGLPGNYLHGSVHELSADSATPAWSVQLHDGDDGAAVFDALSLAAAIVTLNEVVGAAPFHLEELAALGFRMI